MHSGCFPTLSAPESFWSCTEQLTLGQFRVCSIPASILGLCTSLTAPQENISVGAPGCHSTSKTQAAALDTVNTTGTLPMWGQSLLEAPSLGSLRYQSGVKNHFSDIPFPSPTDPCLSSPQALLHQRWGKSPLVSAPQPPDVSVPVPGKASVTAVPPPGLPSPFPCSTRSKSAPGATQHPSLSPQDPRSGCTWLKGGTEPGEGQRWLKTLKPAGPIPSRHSWDPWAPCAVGAPHSSWHH